MSKRSRHPAFLIAAQIGLAAAALAALTLIPPATGAMALIALDGRNADQLAGPAIDQGALLLGRGPLSNILVVSGSRDRIARAMLSRGVLVIAAPRSWCSSEGSA